jgi:ferric-dicitrate binding protein FerR (iron transport regulator)
MKLPGKFIKKHFGKPQEPATPLPSRQQEQEEWDSIKDTAEKSGDFWNDTWENIRQQRQRSAIVRRVKLAAAAALLAGMVAGSWQLWQPGHTVHKAPVVAMAKWKTVNNSTSEAIAVRLDDSTAVTLFPASALRYQPGFPEQQRAIQLEGTALFDIKQDPRRPFTVSGNGITTTVLGTVFKMVAAGNNSTAVYLYKGKVMVKSADPLQVKLNKDYYLVPGDVFSYDRLKEMAIVVNHLPKTNKRQNTQITDAGVANWYMFDNQELAQVLDQLSAIWNVPIYYNPTDLKGLNFIGKIERTDSLGNVLKDIALLNNLIVVNNGKHYIIKKQPATSRQAR